MTRGNTSGYFMKANLPGQSQPELRALREVLPANHFDPRTAEVRLESDRLRHPMRLRLVPLLLFTLPAWADTYRRQPEVDVVHYEIALQFTEGSETIAGVTRVHVMMRQAGVSQMRLELQPERLLCRELARPGASLVPFHRSPV